MQKRSYPEVWGGIECTINRVGNLYRDQLEHANYYDSDAYTQAVADMGFPVVRFPVLWEKHEPDRNAVIDFSWAERQLSILRSAKVTPIVGLVHHGSGPKFTDLTDENFPYLLAEYAGKVARAFPFVAYYTPVNEPLTTARFSGLYGHWFPHQQSNYNFLKILLNELKGIVLSMQVIRAINPRAKLVQTEDLCKVHSTPYMQYQADFENERRWLTQDILCGRLDQSHPLWKYFLDSGIEASELEFFTAHPCPPDINGFNYYVTSERYLDENLNSYDTCTHGSNWIDRYADTEAVRVEKRVGVKTLLREAWERFRLPMALTEVHLGCTVEEQMRWFKEIYDECVTGIAEGMDIRGVTAWSLLGSYDWNSLLTRIDYRYEAGAFDISGESLRSTELANMITAYANRKRYTHPVLSGKGWWHGPQGLEGIGKQVSPLLLVGNHYALGNAFAQACSMRGLSLISLEGSAERFSEKQLMNLVAWYKPWGVINVIESAEPEEQAVWFQLVNRALDHLIECHSQSPYLTCDGISFHSGIGDPHALQPSQELAMSL